MQDTPIQDVPWNPPADTRWDAFIEWARLFYQWDGFHEGERNYKLEIAQSLSSVRDMLLDGFPNWEAGLKGPRSPGYHLVNWRVYSAFRNLLDKDKPHVAGVLRQFWQSQGVASPDERIRQFEERIAVGPRGQMAAALLLADDPANNPPYRSEYLNRAYQMVGRDREEVGDDGGRRYRRMLEFLDEFVRRAEDRGLHILDRLDAQSLVWCVMVYGTERPPANEWPERLRLQYDAYLHGEAVPPPALPREAEPEAVAEEVAEEEAVEPVDPWSKENLAALADELLWDEGELAEVVADLKEKRQVIFYGPPGTGKTYVARRIARQCLLGRGDCAIVQFHPSYSYEDFVEGFRPRLHNGQPGFELVPGPLRRIAAQAAANPSSTYVLVIDELNRGNVAKVFGELYFLLEYRDEEMELQYSGAGQSAGLGKFRLPENLWFICTMNTADRSIALMDAALRRRFYFAPFFSGEPPVRGLLQRWLERHNPGMSWLAGLVDVANERLGDRHLSVGPSYFMGDAEGLDEDRARRIWKRAVIPYIEEQFFGNEDRLAEFDFDLLKGELARRGNGIPADLPPSAPGGLEDRSSNGASGAPAAAAVPDEDASSADANAPTA